MVSINRVHLASQQDCAAYPPTNLCVQVVLVDRTHQAGGAAADNGKGRNLRVGTGKERIPSPTHCVHYSGFLPHTLLHSHSHVETGAETGTRLGSRNQGVLQFSGTLILDKRQACADMIS